MNSKLVEAFMIISMLIGIYMYIETQSYFQAALPVFITLLIILIVTIFKKLYEDKKIRIKNDVIKKSGIRDIDKMEGLQFEEYLSHLFKKHGYKSKVTKGRGDFGADLVLKKDGETIVVQAKRYSSKVGIKAVQEISSSMNYYKANKAMCITNNGYTKSAIELAKLNKVELVDRGKLIEMIVKLNPTGNNEDIQKIKETIIPLCTICKKEMVVRHSKVGKFYGCANYPVCKKTVSI